MKVDHEEQVSQLFKGTAIVDTQQKKLVFKLINAVKNNKNTCSTDEIWSQFLKSSDRDTMRKDTMESLVTDRAELVRIVEALERDNLVMYAAEDNQVVLIWDWNGIKRTSNLTKYSLFNIVLSLFFKLICETQRLNQNLFAI